MQSTPFGLDIAPGNPVKETTQPLSKRQYAEKLQQGTGLEPNPEKDTAAAPGPVVVAAAPTAGAAAGAAAAATAAARTQAVKSEERTQNRNQNAGSKES